MNRDRGTKEGAFGTISVLLEQGRLALPRCPRLLGQLPAMEYEERSSVTVKIEVPPRVGHDDMQMALSLAMAVGDVASEPVRLRLLVAEGRIPRLQVDAYSESGRHRAPKFVRDKAGDRRFVRLRPGFSESARRTRRYTPPGR